MEGVYTVHHIPSDYQEADYEIQLFENPVELALLNYLKFVQEGEGCIPLSEGAVQEMTELNAEFEADMFSDGMYCRSFSFLQQVSVELLNEVGTCLAEHQDVVGDRTLFSTEEAEKVMKDHVHFVKHVRKTINTKQVANSYCSVKLPLAFLFRTNTDCDGCFKQWSTDDVIYSMLTMLDKETYQSYKELENACFKVAEIFQLDKHSTFVKLQALLTKQLLSVMVESRKSISFEDATSKAIKNLL